MSGNWNTNNGLSIFIGGILVLVCAGCGGLLPTQTPAIANGTIVERNAGIVSESPLYYDFLIGGGYHKEIEKVSVNCGCTSLSIKNGEILDSTKPFRVIVNLNKEQWGKGSQSFFITLVDGTGIHGRLIYDYSPLPYMNPDTLMFFEDVSKTEIIFCFPGEDNVKFNDITVPIGITWEQKKDSLRRGEIRIVFTLDRSIFQDEPSGMICVFTSSNRKATFSFPYMVLNPPR
ncbi:MAG: hypothetical protein LBU65_08345 [Planctomycetaceae bacterium]|jgi:hypothetical protein|nr:hypothetical protein [Planctomycetaceae bacterium]